MDNPPARIAVLYGHGRAPQEWQNLRQALADRGIATADWERAWQAQRAGAQVVRCDVVSDRRGQRVQIYTVQARTGADGAQLHAVGPQQDHAMPVARYPDAVNTMRQRGAYGLDGAVTAGWIAEQFGAGE